MSKNVNLISLLRRRPQAMAKIKGSPEYPDINGNVYFYKIRQGVIVVSIIYSLPKATALCSEPVLGFHIHSGAACTGNGTDYFSNALVHYNPQNCPHPYHAGDLPPLFSASGTAFSAFLTDRFTTEEIIGKTVIIHSMPDDFTTQPSGNSGIRIACGEIISLNNKRI